MLGAARKRLLKPGFEFLDATHQIALTGPVENLELQTVRVVEEDGVVAGRVVVLTRTTLDLRPLLAQPGRTLVDTGSATGREGDVVDPDRIAVVGGGMSSGLPLAEADGPTTTVAAEVNDPLPTLAFDLADMDVAQRLEQASVEGQAAL